MRNHSKVRKHAGESQSEMTYDEVRTLFSISLKSLAVSISVRLQCESLAFTVRNLSELFTAFTIRSMSFLILNLFSFTHLSAYSSVIVLLSLSLLIFRLLLSYSLIFSII